MLVVAPEIKSAITQGIPVIALETTLIAHGIPRPRNLELAHHIENTVRQVGACPATIGIINGVVKIGLNDDELRQITGREDVAKCSTRDLSGIVARGGFGATTIAATIYLARKTGLRFMATGGLGGVHPGGECSMDISADLNELSRSPMAVFCSGPKIILDLPRTMEVLETQGVAIYGFGCSKLPGFYLQSTEIDVPKLNGLKDLVALLDAHNNLDWPGSLIIANPPPKEFAFSPAYLSGILEKSHQSAKAAKVSGRELTPFLLSQIANRTGQRSVDLNEALVIENAKLAAQTAISLSKD